MSVLLATHDVQLLAASSCADVDGWALPGDGRPIWVGRGSVQYDPPPTDLRATDGGGAGPWAPATRATGTVHLPADAPVQDGSPLLADDRQWVVTQLRRVTDPTGSGALDEITATIREVGQWPA